jgi:hypothetical protein
MNTLRSTVHATAALVILGVAAASVAGCAAATNDDSSSSEESDLVTFPAASFASAPVVTAGQTRTVAVAAQGFAALRFAGKKNESITISVRDADGFAEPRTYLVERLADGRFAAVLKTPLTASSKLSYRLEATKDYFIVVREANRGAASFAVTLASETLCAGAPRTFTAAELGKRMEQGTNTLDVSGNLAFSPSPERPNGMSTTWRYLINAGSTILDMAGTGARIDLATGTVTADDPALAAESHVEITDKCVAIENSRFSFSGYIPGVAGRTTVTPTSKPFACESGATVVDEELLVSRMPAGESSIGADKSPLMWTEWRCSSLTGCFQRSGVEAEDTVGGSIDVDPTTQQLSFGLLHKDHNMYMPEEHLPLTKGTFTWGAYTGRVTKKFVVITETRPYSTTVDGVKQTAEYRAVYCLPW